MVAASIALAVIGLITAAVFLIRRQYSYWRNHGVPYVQPSFPYGNLRGVGSELHTCELMHNIYKDFKQRGPFVGLYFFMIRVVLLTDLDLVKNVMIKDSHLFNERRTYYNDKDDPLSAHLFSIDGPKWKNLRSKLTPTFTSGKMKYMFNTVTEVSGRLAARLAEVSAQPDGKSLEIKDFWARYSTDVIGSCAFGIECNTINAKNAQFREMGRVIFEEPRHSMMFQSVLNQVAGLGRLLKIKQLPTNATDFFMGIVKETIEYRETEQGSLRKDFMSILMELKNNPALSAEQRLNVEEIAAQALIFFLAGFETSSSLLSFCSYELAIHTDIQARARAEVEEVLSRHDGQFTYEAMMELKYCDQVLNEALRKYPPLATLSRGVSKDYPVPGSKLVIPGGVTVVIPVLAIHHDPEIYPDPERFDPDRFTPEQMQSRHPASFLPFGDGPRNCIGLRFGMMQARIGLVALLQNFRFTLDPRMSIPLRLNKKQFIIASDEGIWLQLERLQK